MTFYYCRGLAETHTPWQRPSENRVLKFLDRAIPVVEAMGLELWLSGGVLRNPETTWDVDCFLIGKVDNQTNEDIQHALIDEGFRQGILIDPYWISNHSPAYRQDSKWFQQPARVHLLYPVIWRNRTKESTIDHRGRPGIPEITDFLVEFRYGYQPLKEKHIPYLEKHGDFQTVNAVDYALNLANTENTLNMQSTSGNLNV